MNLQERIASLLAEFNQGEILNELSTQTVTEEYAPHIASARNSETDDLEIDDLPLLSPTDDGCWVSAWIYVRDSEV